MLTKWAKDALRVKSGGVTIPGTASNACLTYYEFKNSDGDNYYGSNVAGTSSYGLLSSLTAHGSSASSGIALGTGTTAPTDEDYTIESIISSGLSFSATPHTNEAYDSTNDVYSIYLDLTIANSSAEAITISELCFFVYIYGMTSLGVTVSTAASNRNCTLVDRTILETPVTIPAGESKTIRYSFNY